ncbi:MAG: hypothetical protein LBT48_00985 [Prevotellaceae bacterium]|jgi:hypothetical protein|nr:hypothetical protein [Prevotellaceae bacterium]
MLKNFNLLLGIICMLFATTCDESKYENLEEYFCHIDAEIDMFADTSFFSEITCMQYYQGSLYALDAGRRDVAVFPEDYAAVSFAGQPGQGPQDLTSPNVFYVSNDTISVLDDGIGLKQFYRNKFVNLLKAKLSSNCRFTCVSNKYYIPAFNENYLFAVLKNNGSENDVVYGGHTVKFNSVKETIFRNLRKLLSDSLYLYAVSDNIPNIEKYDLTTYELIETLDLSDVPIIKKYLRHIASESLPPDTYIKFMGDAYLSDNFLYVLCASPSPDYKTNTILKIGLYPEMKPVAMIYLPDKIYSAFCVSPKYIHAFNSRKATIERFEIPMNDHAENLQE